MLVAGKNSFGGANAVTLHDDATIYADTFMRLDGYLDNLAAAATTERTTLSQLIENNATLTANVTSLTASVASLTATYAILAAGKPPARAPAATAAARPARPSYLAANGYCWTHGYRVRIGHDSATCKDKGDGHKDGATRANTMGGSNNNKGWDT